MFVLVIVVLFLLFGGFILLAFTMKTVIAFALVGVGLFLFVKPQALSGLGVQGRILVPLVLIILGILVYAGAFSSLF